MRKDKKQSTFELIDQFGRKIDYLRLSITDLCNLRCFYCMPTANVTKLAQPEILRYEEHIQVVRVAASLGVSKVRITGGEPLIKKDVVSLVREIASCSGVKTVGLTTNGILLDRLAEPLERAGLTRINVSLDSLDPDVYRKITGRGDLDDALRGIDRALEVGFKIKINAVLLHDLNLNEIDRFVRFAREKQVELRFIERMSFEDNDPFFPQDEAIAALAKNHRITPVPAEQASPHVRLFDCDGVRVGFISPRSRPFCDGCNKLRLTPHGQLRACLASGIHVDMRAVLRRPHNDDDIRRAILNAATLKPKAGPWDTTAEMWRVGG